MTNVANTAISTCGQLREKDVKRATQHLRQSEIGLTTFYYAGATAPIISSAMGVLARTAFTRAEFTPYWTQLLGAIIAAMAGITWFLIFLRWAYSPGSGRGTELTEETRVELRDDVIVLERGHIRKEIGWAAVKSVKSEGKFTTIEVEGAEAIVIPSNWFDDKQARIAFQGAISEKAPI